MYIILITPEFPPKIGGVGRSAVRLGRNLTQAGHPTTIVTYERSDRLTAPIVSEDGSEAGCPEVVRIGPIVSGGDWAGPETKAFLKRQFVDTAVDYLERRKPWDIVLSLGLVDAGFPGLAVAQGLAIPHVVSARGADVGTEIFMGSSFPLARWVVERSAAVTFVNTYLRDIAVRVFGDDKRFSVIRNAIGNVPGHDVALRRAIRERVRGQLEIREEAAVIGWTGTFRQKKGLEYLSAAFHDIAREREDAYLLVIGGPRSPGDRRLCPVLEHPEFRDRIRLPGLVDMNAPICDFYHAMDVFAYPSLDDGMANAILEAGASATPVVTTDVFSDVFTHSETALLVPRYDSCALAGAIRSLIDDRARAREIAARAERHIRVACAPEKETNAYLSLFRGVLEGHGR